MEHGERCVIALQDTRGGGRGDAVGALYGACFKYMVHEEGKDCIKDYFLPRGIGVKYSNP